MGCRGVGKRLKSMGKWGVEGRKAAGLEAGEEG
jgi:hypothetical protein